jgi:hypothetical protein
MGASVAGFIIPGVLGLNNAGTLHNMPGALEMFVIMALLCMAAALAGDVWGYRVALKSRIRSLSDYDWRRILEAALILNSIAFLASMMSQFIFQEEIAKRTTIAGGMTGPMVIIIFFGTVHRYGFALALLLYWERRSVLALAMIAFGATNYLYAIFAVSRRGPALEFTFIVLVTYALGRRKPIPAILISALFVIGTFWSNAISEFRTIDDRSFLEKWETADYIGSLVNVLDKGALEVQNGAEVIAHTYEHESYDYGKLHWVKIVNAYFPGQIFGYDVKEKVRFFDYEDIADQANRRRGTVGASATGMADCFSSFGFFGCLKYTLIGFVMGRWYRRAFAGDLQARLAYSTLMSGALHTVSHGTSWLLNEYIHMAIFSYPLLYWASKPAAVVNAARRQRPGWTRTEPVRGVARGLEPRI